MYTVTAYRQVGAPGSYGLWTQRETCTPIAALRVADELRSIAVLNGYNGTIIVRAGGENICRRDYGKIAEGWTP